jgi:hypothetical protein
MTTLRRLVTTINTHTLWAFNAPRGLSRRG